MSIDIYNPDIGPVESTGGVRAPDESQIRPKPPSALTNEGLQVPGMRVILAPIPGLTKKGIMVDGSGKPRSFRFQIPPLESFTRSLAFAHSDYDTLRLGQHSRPGGKQLESIRFQTLIVDMDVPWAVYPNTQEFNRTFGPGYSTLRDEMWNLLNITDQLEEILESGSPVKLYAGQPVLWQGGGGESGWDVNMPVTLRSLNIEERAGEPDARYIDVEFVEYRSLKLNRRRLGKAGKAKKTSAKRPAVVEIYADGRAFDMNTETQIATKAHPVTLYALAKRYFGDPSWATLIVRANPTLLNMNMSADDSLGRLTSASFKLRIPGELDEAGASWEGSYLNPNADLNLATIPEESL